MMQNHHNAAAAAVEMQPDKRARLVFMCTLTSLGLAIITTTMALVAMMYKPGGHHHAGAGAGDDTVVEAQVDEHTRRELVFFLTFLALTFTAVTATFMSTSGPGDRLHDYNAAAADDAAAVFAQPDERSRRVLVCILTFTGLACTAAAMALMAILPVKDQETSGWSPAGAGAGDDQEYYWLTVTMLCVCVWIAASVFGGLAIETICECCNGFPIPADGERLVTDMLLQC